MAVAAANRRLKTAIPLMNHIDAAMPLFMRTSWFIEILRTLIRKLGHVF